MKRLLRLCSNRKSSRELLSTSEASWATTKSVGMWEFRMPTAIAPAPTVPHRVQLTAPQRTCLEQMARRQTSPQRLVRRAKILLALETGANQCHVTRQRRLNRGTVHTWRQRWLALAPKLEPI